MEALRTKAFNSDHRIGCIQIDEANFIKFQLLNFSFTHNFTLLCPRIYDISKIFEENGQAEVIITRCLVLTLQQYQMPHLF